MRRVLLSAAGWILLAGPAISQTLVDAIVAKVNSDIILKSDIERQKLLLQQELAVQGVPQAEIGARVEAASPDLLRNLIDESLLLQKAREYGIESDANLQVLRVMEQIREENGLETIEELEDAIIAQGDSPESFRESIRNNYLSQQVLNREVRARIILTTEELRAYYDEHLEEFDRPRGVNLAEIVKVIGGRTPEEVEAIRAEMEAILGRIRDGEDFFEIAAAESESVTAADGGVLGYFEDGMLGGAFETAARDLRRNEVSNIFEAGDALVIIKLLERHEGGILSFGLARNQLENILLREKETPMIRAYLTRLREDGFVKLAEGYVDTGAPEPAGPADPDA